MKTIYKYPLRITGEQTIELPLGADFLDVQMQDGPAGPTLTLWCLVDPDESDAVPQTIGIVGTGHPCPYDEYEHVGTVQDGTLVWHVFAPGRR